MNKLPPASVHIFAREQQFLEREREKVFKKNEVEFAGKIKCIFGGNVGGSGCTGCVVACCRIPISVKQAANFSPFFF